MRKPAKVLFLGLIFSLCSLAIFSGQIFTAEDANGNLIASDKPITAEQKKAEMENALASTRQQLPVPMAGGNAPTASPISHGGGGPTTSPVSQRGGGPIALPETPESTDEEVQAEKLVPMRPLPAIDELGEKIKPFGDFSWEDTFPDVVQKLNKIKVESKVLEMHLGLYVSGPMDMTGLDNFVDVQAKLNKIGVRDDWQDMPKKIPGTNKKIYWFCEHPDEVTSIYAKPILVSGIPFELRIYFAGVPGLLVRSPEKVLKLYSKAKKTHYYYPLLISKMELYSNSPNIPEHIESLKAAIKSKYNGFSSYKDENGAISVADGNFTFNFDGRVCMIKYQNDTYIKQYKEFYRLRVSDLESAKNKDKKDLGSGL